jgi:hypothetical protein
MTVAGGGAPDWRTWLLVGSAAVFASAAALMPAQPQPAWYHAFADCRTFWAVPNFFNVLSNLPFLAAGGMGLALLWRGRGEFADPREQMPYLVFFLGALLTSAGSAYYHLAPDNGRLVWDRLPMTLGFAGLVSAAITERVQPRAGLRLLWPLLAVGAGTVLFWYATETRGRGNLVPYAAFQAWAILAIVLLIAVFPARRYSHGHLLLWAAGWYGMAKVFETFDLQIYRWLGDTLSGHTIKHLLAGAGVFAIVRQLRLRRSLAAPDADSH